MTTLDAAKKWTAQGYRVIPVAHREKRPTLAGWQDLKLGPDDLPRYFGGQVNIGLLLGDPHGICDIDIDDIRATAIWQAFAPPTGCVFGRDSKPCSHWLYHCDPPVDSIKFSDPIDKACLLEMRCLGGRQTVVPPSVHPTGETIRYEPPAGDGTPANVDADVLVKAASRTAAACLLARHYPAKSRHEVELALSGALGYGGMTEEEATVFVVATYRAVDDHDREAIPRIRQAVSDTFRRQAESEPTTGVPALAALMDSRVVSRVMDWLGIHDQKTTNGDWRDSLLCSRNGPKACVANAVLSLSDSAWAGVFAYNENSARVELHAPYPGDPHSPPLTYPRRCSDPDLTSITAWMQSEGIMVPSTVAGEAVLSVSQHRRYNPVRDYLDSLTWDQRPRIDGWLASYLGAPDSEYTRAVGARFLISGVARVFEPGCKVDTCMVLEGEQGVGKSTALQALAVRAQWFTDRISDLRNKDALMEVHGPWIIEFAELASMRHAEIEVVKAFMTSTRDMYRPPYGRSVEEHPRSSIFAASVNPDGTDYLKDTTGGRRFWIVPVAAWHPVYLDDLKRDVHQLWAEAATRYRAGDHWHMDTPKLEALAKGEAADRTESDAWEQIVADYCEGRSEVSTNVILRDSLSIPAERFGRDGNGHRVARILKKLGYVQVRTATSRVWRRQS